MLGLRSPAFVARLGEAGFAFDPASLFAASEPGAWLDPSDPATLFSDTAGTTQAGIGDPVALVLDKSGNGNHATQPTLASRPILRESDGLRYLELDGVDDFLFTPTITPGTDKVHVFAGARALVDQSGVIIGHGSGAFNDSGTVIFWRSPGVPVRYRFRAVIQQGGDTNQRDTTNPDFTAPHSAVLAGSTAAGGQSVFRVNGSVVDEDASVGSGNYAPQPAFVGGRNDDGTIRNFFNGNVYSLITRFGPNLDDPTIERTERYVAKRTGVSL